MIYIQKLVQSKYSNPSFKSNNYTIKSLAIPDQNFRP